MAPSKKGPFHTLVKQLDPVPRPILTEHIGESRLHGTRKVCLLRTSDVFDAMTLESVAVETDHFTASLPPRSSRLFYHGQAPFP